MSNSNKLILVIVALFAIISSNIVQAQDKDSDTWVEDNHWAEYYTNNATHTCSRCYDNGGTNCIDYEFKQSVCCNHTITLEDGTKSDLQDQCMARYKYCSKGLDEPRYKALTCAQQNCPLIKNVRTSAMLTSNTITEDYMDETQKYSVKMDNQQTGLFCKIVFNTTSILNGKQTLKFNTLTGVGNLQLFKWPTTPKGTFQHGISENGEVEPVKGPGTVYEAPSDWSLFVVYNIGPYDGNFEIETKTVWYEKTDVPLITNVWKPTETYFQPWVGCRADRVPVKNNDTAIESEGAAVDPNVGPGPGAGKSTKGSPSGTPPPTKPDESGGLPDVNKCTAASASGDIKPFPFIPTCCLGTENGVDFDFWCLPLTFRNVQLNSANYQGMTFQCPPRKFEDEQAAGAGASNLIYTTVSASIFMLSSYY